MLHLYYGADDFGMREASRDLRARLDTDGLLDANTSVLAPRGLAPGVLIQHASTLPFLAAARLVIVEGLVGSLGGGRNVVAEWQPLLDLLPELPPTNHLLLLEPLVGREGAAGFSRSAFARALRELRGAEVREFRELRTYGGPANEVATWIRERAASLDISIERPAIEELVGLVGANLWVLAAELDKLARYAAGRPVTVEDVRLLTPEAQEQSIFNVVDAVVEGRAAAALLMIRDMLERSSENPPRIQAMIARQLRNLVRAAELIEAGAPQQAIGEATGVTNSYALRKLLDQTRAGRPAFEAGLRAVEASDHAVKTGERSDVLALELLVMRLAELMAQPRAPSGSRRGAAARR